MGTLITLQPAPVVDCITPDGRELTRLPYPFHVHEDGTVARQDFWRGDPAAVVGFQNRADVQHVDLWWADVVTDPRRAVGKYMVSSGPNGLVTHLVAIESVRVHDIAAGDR